MGAFLRAPPAKTALTAGETKEFAIRFTLAQ
jgi:hypothetical protein